MPPSSTTTTTTTSRHQNHKAQRTRNHTGTPTIATSSSSSSSSSNARQHHVFLVRHCVRSTSRRERLRNNWTALANQIEDEHPMEDFVNESMSNWNTPDYWCTQTGADIMQGTGRYLLDYLLAAIGDNNSDDDDDDDDDDDGDSHGKDGPFGRKRRRIRFQVMTDVSQRDVDTAFALVKGLRQRSGDDAAYPSLEIELEGLDELTYYRSLFDPWDAREGICTNRLATEVPFQNQLRHEIQHRLDTLPPPEPGLEEILELIERRGGQGRLGSVQDIPNWVTGSGEDFFGAPPINTTSPFPVVVDAQSIYLAGPINIVRWIGEAAFFSRAGGIKIPFLWNATLNNVYKLVEWAHWSRAILVVENTLSASKGSVMAEGIVTALRDGHLHIPRSSHNHDTSASHHGCDNNNDNDNEDLEYDAKVIIIVGHDGNMDSVATALGLQWRLAWPYHTSPGNQLGEYAPTPPGSAMHFALDTETHQVRLSFLYPIHLSKYVGNTTARIPKGMMLNASGILEETPLVLIPRESIQDVVPKSMLKFSDDRRQMVLPESGLDILEQQLGATLLAFPDARECYNAFVNRTKLSATAASEQTASLCRGPDSALSDGSGMQVVLFLALVAVPVILLIGCLSWWQKRPKRKVYHIVNGDLELV